MTQKEFLLKSIKSTKEDILNAVFIYQKDNKMRRCLVEDLVEEFDFAIAFTKDFIFVPRCIGNNWVYEPLPRNPEIVLNWNKIPYIEG